MERHQRDTENGPSKSEMKRMAAMRGHNAHQVVYSARYDAIECVDCNQWIEFACDDPHCEYECSFRPSRPSHVAKANA